MLDRGGHHSQKVAVCLGQIKGITLHVLSDRNWVPVRFSRHVTSFHSHPHTANESEQIEAIIRTVRRTNSNVLLPVTDCGTHLVCAWQTELSRHVALPPLPSTAGLKAVLDKNSLSRFLAEHGLPQPPTMILHSPEQAEIELRDLPFPALIKPANGSGGCGIRKFANRALLMEFLRTNWSRERPALVQSYVQGRDVGCSVLCKDGKILAHTIQTSHLPRPDPFGNDEAVEFINDPQTLEVVAKLVSALNWGGVANIDLRRGSDEQILLLDFNPRYWTSLLGSLSARVNFPHLACLAALGIQPARFAPELKRFFTTDAVIRHFIQKCLGRPHSRVCIKESGLPYTLNDPLPRAFVFGARIRSRLKKLNGKTTLKQIDAPLFGLQNHNQL